MGFYKDSVVYKLKDKYEFMKLKLFLNDTKSGEDEGKVFWYSELYFNVNKFNEIGKIETKGTFRSRDCFRSGDVGIFVDDICFVCTKIFNLKSFKKRLILRLGMSEEIRDIIRIRNDYLIVEEMKNKLDE